ncbi:hypothetical protein AGMMS49942_17250 [Spirochaetia bacterium]|nr:hypothetical protein AGMMS49942_17250 [Spirochaetia bacterium]
MKRINHGLIVGLAVLLLAAVTFVGCENPEAADGLPGAPGKDGTNGTNGTGTKGADGKDAVWAPPASIPVAEDASDIVYLWEKGATAVSAGVLPGNNIIPTGKTLYFEQPSAATTLAKDLIVDGTLIVYGDNTNGIVTAATGVITSSATTPTTAGAIVLLEGGKIDAKVANSVKVKSITVGNDGILLASTAAGATIEAGTITIENGGQFSVTYALTTTDGIKATAITVNNGGTFSLGPIATAGVVNVGTLTVNGTLVGTTGAAQTLVAGTGVVKATTLNAGSTGVFQSGLTTATQDFAAAGLTAIYAKFNRVVSTGNFALTANTTLTIPAGKSFDVKQFSFTGGSTGTLALTLAGGGDLIVGTTGFLVNSGTTGTNDATVILKSTTTIHAGGITLKAASSTVDGKVIVATGHASNATLNLIPGLLTIGSGGSGGGTTLDGVILTFGAGSQGVGDTTNNPIKSKTASNGTERVVFAKGSEAKTAKLAATLPAVAVITTAATYKPDSAGAWQTP